MDSEEQQKAGLLMGVELGSHVSAVASGTLGAIKETACAESDPRIAKNYAASYVVFDNRIIRYGEEAAAYTAIEPRETLVVPLAVALGLFLQHLQVAGNPSAARAEQRRRAVTLAKCSDMCSYDAATTAIQHPQAACLVVPSATSLHHTKSLIIAALIAGLRPPYLLRRIDALINRFACENVQHIYRHFMRERDNKQLLSSSRSSHDVSESQKKDVYVALLDFNYTETSVAILRLHKPSPAPDAVRNITNAVEEGGNPQAEDDMRDMLQEERKITCAVLARRVNPDLGFVDVLSLVAQHVADHLEKRYSCVVRTHTRGSWRLQLAREAGCCSLCAAGALQCQRAIEDLYDAEEATIDLVDFGVPGTDLSLRFSQHHFERICQPIAEKLGAFLNESFSKARVSPHHISLIELTSDQRYGRLRWLVKCLDRVCGAAPAGASEYSNTEATAADAAAEAPVTAATAEAFAEESACPAASPGVSPLLFRFPGQLRLLQSSAAAAAGALYFCAAEGRFVTTLDLQHPHEEEDLEHSRKRKTQGEQPEDFGALASLPNAEQSEDTKEFRNFAHHLIMEEAKELRLRSIAAYLESRVGKARDVFEQPEHLSRHRSSGGTESDSSSSSTNISSTGGGKSGGEPDTKEGFLKRMRSFLKCAAAASQEEVQEKYEEFRKFLFQEHGVQTDEQNQRDELGDSSSHLHSTAKHQHERSNQQKETEAGERGNDEQTKEDDKIKEEIAILEDADDAENSHTSNRGRVGSVVLPSEQQMTKNMENLLQELKITEGSPAKSLHYYQTKLKEDIKEARLENDNGHSELALYLSQRASKMMQKVVDLRESKDSFSGEDHAWLRALEVDIHVEIARASLAAAEKEHAVALRKQELCDVVQHCDAALTKTPDRTQAYYCRSKAFLLLGEYEQAHRSKMAVVEPQPDDIIFGLEMGPDLSVVATGLRKDVESCVNTGGVSTHFNKHDFPSTVAFSGKIRLYGEEAECRVNYEPKDTLVCLPMWIPVRSAADGQDVEQRLTHAPLVEVTTHKGSVTFHVDVDHKKVAVPLPVVLGDFIRYLHYMGLVMNPEFTRRIGNLKGVQLRQQLQQHHDVIRHVGVVTVPAFVTEKDQRVITAALAISGIPMQVINRTSAIVNWWCCDKLPGAYDVLQQLRKTQPPPKGEAPKDDDPVLVGILDVNAADTSFVILELRPGTHPNVDKEHLKKQPQQQVSVKVLAGETAANLGFLDITRLLAEKVKQYLKEHFKVEIREHTERFWKLSLACGRCVRTLCDVEESVVDMDDFVVKKTHLRMECNRKHLQNICAPLIEPYRKFLLNTISKAGLGNEQQSRPLTAVYAIGTHIRIPWILETTEEVLGHGDHFSTPPPFGSPPAAAGADKGKGTGCCCGNDMKGRLHFITERGGQVAAYGAAYFAAGKAYIRVLPDEGQQYSDAELLEMTSLEQQLTQIEHREVVRREMYAKVNSYVLEMREFALSTYPTLVQDSDRTAKVVRDAEAALTSLRDSSEEQLKKVHEEFRTYFQGHEPRLYEKVDSARLARVDQHQHMEPFNLKRTMDLIVRHIGEERDAKLPADACADRAKRDLEEAKRLIESGQYDLGIFTAEKCLDYLAHIDPKDMSDATLKERVGDVKLEAPLQLAKAQTLKAEHDRAIDERASLLDSAITHCTTVLTADPSNVEAYLLRGRAYKAKGDLDNAEKDAQSGLKLLPGGMPCFALHMEVEQRKKRQAR